jgi:hypothetical protein
MNWAQWLGVIEWMIPRWPDAARLQDEETEAFYADLQGYDHGEVMVAVENIWRTGREKMPRAGKILKTLEALGFKPTESPVAHRHGPFGHVHPSQATAAVPDGYGEVWCANCGELVRACECAECRADPKFHANVKGGAHG